MQQNEHWQKALEMARTVNDHYSMWEEQQAEIFKHVMRVPQGGVVVELGVAYGKTSVVMAYAAKVRGARFYAVDDFSLVGNASEYLGRLEAMDLPVTLLIGKTQQVPWNLEISLMVIDAGHDEQNIKADCERWIPFIKPGGVVCFHDFEQGEIDQSHPHWAVRFYADKFTKNWEELAWVKQLKIRRRPLI